MTNTTIGAVARLDSILVELDRRAADCAARCKVTLWAYYGRAADNLRLAFAQTERTDEAVAETAEALVLQAAEECPNLVRDDAARLWASAVYARKILGRTDKVSASLGWLRARANVRRPMSPAQAAAFVETATDRSTVLGDIRIVPMDGPLAQATSEAQAVRDWLAAGTPPDNGRGIELGNVPFVEFDKDGNKVRTGTFVGAYVRPGTMPTPKDEEVPR